MASIFYFALFFLSYDAPLAHGLGQLWEKHRELEHASWTLTLAENVMKSTDNKLDDIETIRQENMENAPFEIGFALYHIQEKYRKMVDKYNVSVSMSNQLFTVELMNYLSEIEALYYEIEHVGSVHSAITSGPESKQLSILNELSWPLKVKLLNDLALTTESSRRVGIQAFVMGRRQEDEAPSSPSAATSAAEDDGNMRMKLFRLMYETVRDSDLKVKRAELIKGHYSNSSVFEIGYLMGDVTDKFNIMTDISMTLRRLHAEWRPIEHINAYEQIANLAIEISHLVDLLRAASKRDSTDKPPEVRKGY